MTADGLRAAAEHAEIACRKFIEGTFARVDEIRARQALDDLRAALSSPLATPDRADRGDIDAMVREYVAAEDDVYGNQAPTREQWDRVLAARTALREYARASFPDSRTGDER